MARALSCSGFPASPTHVNGVFGVGQARGAQRGESSMTAIDFHCLGLLLADLAFWLGLGVIIYQGAGWFGGAEMLILLPLAIYCAVRAMGWMVGGLMRWLRGEPLKEVAQVVRQ